MLCFLPSLPRTSVMNIILCFQSVHVIAPIRTIPSNEIFLQIVIHGFKVRGKLQFGKTEYFSGHGAR